MQTTSLNFNKIINPFNKNVNQQSTKYYYIEQNEKPIYRAGDYAIYRLNSVSWVYTYKNLAFNELAGENREHLINVANRARPNEAQMGFLYDRAVETIEKNINLISI